MYKIEAGAQTVLEGLRAKNLVLEAPCNGKHLCGKCKVRIRAGEAGPITPEEAQFLTTAERAAGIRLACFARAETELEVECLGQREHHEQILSGGEFRDVPWNPMLTLRRFLPLRPTLDNQYTLWDCVARPLGLTCSQPSLTLLRALPELIAHPELFAVFSGDRLIALSAEPVAYALAVDIGTTTVVCSLVDMQSGKVVTEEVFLNPQKAFGLDVLSRIHHSMEAKTGSAALQRVLIERLNTAILTLTERIAAEPERIYEAVISGNATMIHSLLAMPLSSLGRAPYASVYRQAVAFSAITLGLEMCPEGIIYCVPAVSTYIGGDIVAGAMVANLDQARDNVLLIDIGTNGEIVLSRKGRLISCSCAAGPALEGMNISCGMRAEPGAIEGVQFRDGHFVLSVIGGGIPQGICGSGILEAVCAGLHCGAISTSGRLNKRHPLVEAETGFGRLILSAEHGICLSQKDIRQVQLSKGAILSGVLSLLHHAGLEETQIDRVLVAGQFGKHLTPESLTGAGLIPMELRDKILYIGNSAQMGAVACLHSQEKRRQAERIAEEMDYIELSALEGYETVFARAMTFRECVLS